MYLEDPFDKALKPVNLPEEQEPDPRMDRQTVFWEEAASTLAGRDISAPERLYTQVCRFENGVHTEMADKCPHFNESDEEGRQIVKGWTCQ